MVALFVILAEGRLQNGDIAARRDTTMCRFRRTAASKEERRKQIQTCLGHRFVVQLQSTVDVSTQGCTKIELMGVFCPEDVLCVYLGYFFRIDRRDGGRLPHTRAWKICQAVRKLGRVGRVPTVPTFSRVLRAFAFANKALLNKLWVRTQAGRRHL